MPPSVCNRLRRALVLTFAALAAGRAATAQIDPWEHVNLIGQGQDVAITLHTHTRITGRMQSWSPEGLRIQQGKLTTHVARANIARVETNIGMTRGRKAILAAAIVGGLSAGLTAAGCSRHGCQPSTATIVAGSGVLFGGGAAAIASLFPPHIEAYYTAAPPPGSWKSTRQLYAGDASVRTGEKFPVRLQILGDGGHDISSPLLIVHAVGVSSAADPSASVKPLPGDPGVSQTFTYDARVGDSGGYRFDVDTTGLPPGIYSLHYRVGADTDTHVVPFRVK